MKKLDTAIAAIAPFAGIEIGSIALGYRVLNVVANADGVRVLEASPCGANFFILLSGAMKDLESAIREGRQSLVPSGAEFWIDSEIVPSKDSSILDAFFALTQESMDESIVVVECETICGCLSAAHTLVEGCGLKPIEIRVLRSSTGAAYGFFTGGSDKCGPAAEDARTKLRASVRKGRVEVIDQPAKSFRSFFELTGVTGSY